MTPEIVVSPCSNDTLRDWPLGHYRALAALLLERMPVSIGFVGTAAQREAVAAAMTGLPRDRAANLCGTTDWAGVRALVTRARCVVSNNSGVAHLAAGLGVPTVCIFAATHDPLEWMPRGRAATTLVKRTACAPCGIARLSECAYGHRCLTGIAPETVFAVVAKLLA